VQGMSGSKLMKRDESVLVVVDIQEKLMAKIANREDVVRNATKLVRVARLLGIPVIITEQYPKGLGRTIREIKELVPNVEPVEKLSFNCYLSKEFVKRIQDTRATALILCGVEGHVCITQTALTGVETSKVFVVCDAVSSIDLNDLKIAFERIKQEGVILVSTEMVIFELLERAGTDEFKEALEIIKH
jgi:isochorismate hydrolase